MKKILSIDGGGIRGLIPALVLAEIEKCTGMHSSALFDLMAGSSTGGILALGLSKGNENGEPAFSAGDMAALYTERGGEIFRRSFWRIIASLGGLFNEKYSHVGIESILKEYFADDTLGASLTDVLISSYDIQSRVPYFFKSWKEECKAVAIRCAARATSAAPSYFEPTLVSVAGEARPLIDGGIFVNNPVVSSYSEIRKRFAEEDDIYMVSLGTGKQTRPIKLSRARRWGKVEWIVPALDCILDGISDAADYQMKHILGDSFVRLQTMLSEAHDDFDDASAGNIEKLRKEAQKLIQTHRKDIDGICDTLTRR